MLSMLSVGENSGPWVTRKALTYGGGYALSNTVGSVQEHVLLLRSVGMLCQSNFP